MADNKKDIFGVPACNEHIGEIAAVAPQKRQCELESPFPARTFVKPLPRQYATTLSASGGQRSETLTIIRETLKYG